MSAVHPSHYDGDACMRALEAAGWLCRKGDPVENAQKALWYARWYQEHGYGPLNALEARALSRCLDQGLQGIDLDQRNATKPVLAQAWACLTIAGVEGVE